MSAIVKYFHEAKDLIFLSRRGDSRVEWKIPLSPNKNMFCHCTNENIHYLFYITPKS